MTDEPPLVELSYGDQKIRLNKAEIDEIDCGNVWVTISGVCVGSVWFHIGTYGKPHLDGHVIASLGGWPDREDEWDDTDHLSINTTAMSDERKLTGEALRIYLETS